MGGYKRVYFLHLPFRRQLLLALPPRSAEGAPQFRRDSSTECAGREPCQGSRTVWHPHAMRNRVSLRSDAATKARGSTRSFSGMRGAVSENQRGQPQRIRHARAPSEKPRSWKGCCQQSFIPVRRCEMQHALFSSEPVLLCGDVPARLFSRTRITQDGD